MFHVKQISTGSAFEAEWGYSRAIVKGGWCFVSGVTSYDYATMTIPEGVVAQAHNCMATVRRVLTDAGFEMADIVRVTYIVKDSALITALSPVLGAAFADIRPAATLMVAGLIRPEILFEIETTAFKG